MINNKAERESALFWIRQHGRVIKKNQDIIDSIREPSLTPEEKQKIKECELVIKLRKYYIEENKKKL